MPEDGRPHLEAGCHFQKPHSGCAGNTWAEPGVDATSREDEKETGLLQRMLAMGKAFVAKTGVCGSLTLAVLVVGIFTGVLWVRKFTKNN